MADAKALEPGLQSTRPGSPDEAHQEDVIPEYLQRAEELDRKPGTPEGAEGPMTKEIKPCGSRMLASVIGAFAEMSSDVEALADATASALAADHIQFISTSAAEAKPPAIKAREAARPRLFTCTAPKKLRPALGRAWG